MDIEIDRYITKHYQHWVDYADCQIRISRQRFDPAEVVNDVLCGILDKDRVRAGQMMTRAKGGGTEFDYFVMRVLKINIQSPRSKFRYQRGQHCLSRLDDKTWAMTAAAESDFDISQAHGAVRSVLNELPYSQLSKDIFAWHFLEGKSFSEWTGRGSKKYLYKTYNRVFNTISCKIRKKFSV